MRSGFVSTELVIEQPSGRAKKVRGPNLSNRIGDAGADDIRLKMWLAARDLVGCGPVTARLRGAAQGLATIREDDFPENVRQRAMRLRMKLLGQYRLLEGQSEPITDVVGEELASEFLAVFAIIANPYFGTVLTPDTAA
jgi:hypothetical protein